IGLVLALDGEARWIVIDVDNQNITVAEVRLLRPLHNLRTVTGPQDTLGPGIGGVQHFGRVLGPLPFIVGRQEQQTVPPARLRGGCLGFAPALLRGGARSLDTLLICEVLAAHAPESYGGPALASFGHRELHLNLI